MFLKFKTDFGTELFDEIKLTTWLFIGPGQYDPTHRGFSTYESCCS